MVPIHHVVVPLDEGQSPYHRLHIMHLLSKACNIGRKLMSIQH